MYTGRKKRERKVMYNSFRGGGGGRFVACVYALSRVQNMYNYTFEKARRERDEFVVQNVGDKKIG